MLGLEHDVIAETIRIRKTYNLKLPDALIAATCLVHDLTLIADNDKDFSKVALLRCINPNKLSLHE
ncbi:PIN domain-containing protein [Pedobacter agri]|uniref:PIN domain-containing protein n=1 Tax=Pedobacter agri TaxID=454586 RepID=UPI00397755FC